MHQLEKKNKKKQNFKLHIHSFELIYLCEYNQQLFILANHQMDLSFASLD